MTIEGESGGIRWGARLLCLTVLGCSLGVMGCRSRYDVVHTVKMEPMHITIDVNIKVDKALDDFFGDLDAGAKQ